MQGAKELISENDDCVANFKCVRDIKVHIETSLNIPLTQQMICLDNVILADATELKLLCP